jgi:hypothetical protein
VTHEQPAPIPHSDFSLRGKDVQLEMAFPGQTIHFKDRDYDLINIWHPLVGPNDDWPLALCDYTSIDDADIIDNDDLHTDRANENSLLHAGQRHRWYCLAKHQPEDVLVFRNIDARGKRARGFHCAVRNPASTMLRQSVEVRLLAILKDNL